MSYEQQYEVQLLTSAGDTNILVSGTGEKCRWTPLYTPHIVRAVSIVPITTSSITAAAKLSVRVATGGAHDTTATADQKTTLTMVTGANPGKVRVRDKLDIDVGVGHALTLHVITAVTDAYKCRASILVEPKWDTLANATGLFTAVTA